MSKKCYFIFILTQGKICDEGPLSTKVYVRKFHYRSGFISKRPIFVLHLLFNLCMDIYLCCYVINKNLRYVNNLNIFFLYR